MLVSFYRADFVTLTAVALSLYYLDKPENCRRVYFRYLVLLIFVSLFYDFLFLFWLNEYGEHDGSGESSLRRFSIVMSWISFCWRVPLSLVFWKDSLDFVSIVKGKDTKGPMSSLDVQVAEIIRRHKERAPEVVNELEQNQLLIGQN
jgi:hypothetical protein